MAASHTALRFPHTRVLLHRTRLAYIHLRNLLNDAKRDRSARISGCAAISLPEELVILYLIGGEVANATVRDSHGSRAVAIPSALDKVPNEAEYVEICLHEADLEQLSVDQGSDVGGGGPRCHVSRGAAARADVGAPPRFPVRGVV
jgi:hypothetical protein